MSSYETASNPAEVCQEESPRFWEVTRKEFQDEYLPAWEHDREYGLIEVTTHAGGVLRRFIVCPDVTPLTVPFLVAARQIDFRAGRASFYPSYDAYADTHGLIQPKSRAA